MRFPNFIGGSYMSQSPLADQERTVNFYVEQIESAGASTKAALYPTPGVESIVTATAGPGSAHAFVDGREFAIIGTTFYEIGQYGALTSHGTVAIDSNPGTISYNGDGGGQLFITSGGNGYLFVLATDTFSTISALAGIATMGDHMDGYFLCLNSANSTVYISALLDGASWTTGADFFQRSIASDPWVSMKAANRYLYLFGSETSEVWYDAGTFPIPFEPHPSGLMQYGCAAPFSPEVVKGTVIWLGQTSNGNGSVLRVSGFTPEEVSNNALQHAFNEYGNIADAIGDTYDDLGHTFYILTFRNANATWCFDDDNGTWCERGTWIVEDNAYDAWRPLYHAFAFSEHRMLDIQSGDVYRMSSTLYTDADGREIRRMRRSPAVVKDNERVFYSSFEVMLEPGIGSVLVSGDSDLSVSGPPAIASTSGTGSADWTNTNNIKVDDTTFAYGTPNGGGGGSLKTIFGYSFGFDIPDDATDVSVICTVRASVSTGTNTCTLSPGTKVSTPGVPFSPDPGAQTFTLTSTMATHTLTYTGYTPTGVNDSAFAVGFNPSSNNSSLTFKVEYLAAEITYTISGDTVARDPLVMMRFSNDGGKTWSAEQERSAGALGEYDKRVRWTRCGSGRKRVFEVSMSDPAPWRVLDAFVDVTPGADSLKAGA